VIESVQATADDVPIGFFDDHLNLPQQAVEPLLARRLIEAGQYVDGEALLILVFADSPDQAELDRQRGDRVRWAVSGYEDWALLSGDRMIARRDDSDEIDVPGFRLVIGESLISGQIRADRMLSLTFSAGYRFEFLAPTSRDLDLEDVPRWSITTPGCVTSLRGSEIVQEG
jgi:hypothetical protein